MAFNNEKLLVATIVATAVLFVTISTATAQSAYNYYAEKPGSCPPALPVDICGRTCSVDGHCLGIGKCCPTSCGGTICSRPVTMRGQTQAPKPGSCPAIPTGRWVCTPTCSADSDCPGKRKCCKNRCGAMACQNPETAPIAPIDYDAIFNGNPDASYEVPPASNPFLVYVPN